MKICLKYSTLIQYLLVNAAFGEGSRADVSHCNKLSLKSVHCSCPPAARRAFPSLSPVFPITLKQIGWKQKPASAGTSGLAAPLGSHHQAGHTAPVAHMAEVPQLTPE